MCEGFEPSMAFTADTLSRAPSITRQLSGPCEHDLFRASMNAQINSKENFGDPRFARFQRLSISIGRFSSEFSAKAASPACQKRPSAMVKSVAVRSVALAPVAIRRNIRGLNDAASSDRSSASDRITASVAGDLPGVSRAIWTAPREAERTRRACGIRTP